MSDTVLTLEIPEALVERAQAVQIDLRQTLIDALQAKLPPIKEDVEILLQHRLSGNALEAALRAYRSGERVLGLHVGAFWMSEDFNDPLPDEFWLSGNP
jgi:hypothetical protein